MFLYKQEDEVGVVESKEKGYIFASEYLKDCASIQRTKLRLQERNLIPENTELYLRNIIEYCQNNEINIELFVSPVYAIETLSTENYDVYYQQISDIASEYAVPFYDFNLCKAEYLDIMHREYFWDIGHLNGEGANLFTPFLWEVLSGEPENNQKYFCTTYKEKLMLDEMETYGVYYEEGENEKYYTIASNRDDGLEYKIEIMSIDDKCYTLQNFLVNKEFALPSEEHGVMVITTRKVNEVSDEQVLKINF